MPHPDEEPARGPDGEVLHDRHEDHSSFFDSDHDDEHLVDDARFPGGRRPKTVEEEEAEQIQRAIR